MTNVYLVGFGGNSKVIIDACFSIGLTVLGIFDDNYEKYKDVTYRDIKPIGTSDDLINSNHDCKNVVITIGNIAVREKLYNILQEKGYIFPNIIHSKVYVSPTAKIGVGNIIYNNAIINSDVEIGNFNLINTSSIIEHDCKIGNFNNISPNTVICGTCVVGDNNFIGASTTFRNNMTVGNNNIIGCASNIVKNIGDNNKGYGNPFHYI